MSDRLCPACKQPLTQREGESASSFKKRKTCGRECAGKLTGRERTPGKRYESRYGAGWIPAAQWLAEYICERMAKKDGRVLPVKFWETPAWKGEFFKQLTLVNRLLDKYEPAAVSKGLRSSRGKTAYSFGAPWLEGAVALEQATINRQREAPPAATVEVAAPDTTEQVRPVFVEKQSIKSKLKGL